MEFKGLVERNFLLFIAKFKSSLFLLLFKFNVIGFRLNLTDGTRNRIFIIVAVLLIKVIIIIAKFVILVRLIIFIGYIEGRESLSGRTRQIINGVFAPTSSYSPLVALLANGAILGRSRALG